MDPYAAIGSTSGIISLVGIIGYGLYKLLVHAHCRSGCCGREFLDLYVNLDETQGDQSVVIPVPPSGVVRPSVPPN
jgi:hypothetical protein